VGLKAAKFNSKAKAKVIIKCANNNKRYFSLFFSVFAVSAIELYLRKSCATVTNFVVSCATTAISKSNKSVDGFDMMRFEVESDAKFIAN